VLAVGSALCLSLGCSDSEVRGGIGAVEQSASAVTVNRTVDANGDCYLKSGSPNSNQGSEPIVRLQSSGKNRALVFFDATTIRNTVGSASLSSATLELAIDTAASNWGSSGRPIAVHRLLQASSEYAATWNCGQDSSIYNSQADCTVADGTAWSMDASDPNARPWQAAATSTTTIVSNQTGVVQLDVTADIAAMLGDSWAGHGFLVKKVDESQSGQVDFVSKERGPAPRLVLTVDVPADAGPADSGGPTVDAGIQSQRLVATSDSHVRQGEPNHNFGAADFLRLQASGRNRALVQFDLGAVTAALADRGLHAARLELTIAQTFDNWGDDRSIGVHRLRHPWTEGGATWNCRDDSDPSNSTDSDCAEPWVMWAPSLPEEQVAWVDPPASTTLINSGQTGVVSLDVTQDLACALAGHVPMHGFLVKKEAESQSGKVEFASRETATPPALIIEHRSGSGVAVTAAQCTASGGGGGSGCTPSGQVDGDCDAQDDDCDGRTDEAYEVVEISCGAGACAATGERSCVNGTVVDACTPGTPAPSDASCDGVDDDCDGAVDEDYATTPTTCTVGGCNAQGELGCVGGLPVDDCATEGQCVSEAHCTDLLDNDGDSAIDCADTADCGARPECDLPPEPAAIAPAIDASAGTPFFDALGFLQQGADPVQRDAVPGAISPAHAALVSGLVRNRDGAALGGVRVSVVGRANLGHTRTRAGGAFDLLVEGGGEVVLRFEHAGYVSVDRAAQPTWRGSERLDDVVMVLHAQDSSVLDTSGVATGYQLAQGAAESDRDGTRRDVALAARHRGRAALGDGQLPRGGAHAAHHRAVGRSRRLQRAAGAVARAERVSVRGEPLCR
jgi:hypothetical protein